MYDYRNRYRCTIIRGKAQGQAEDLIPIYANAVTESEGLSKDEFEIKFNQIVRHFLSSPTEKTLNNHRTEIAEKLFGMYYFEANRLIVAPRTAKILDNEDLPQFFKSLIVNFQFPNGLDKINTISDRIENNIRIKPFHFIVNLLSEADNENIFLTKNEIAYYVLDSKDVLQGIANIKEVLSIIKEHRRKRIINKVEYAGKASSYSMQHISEQLNLLELSNVIIQSTVKSIKIVKLNTQEKVFISYLTNESFKELDFDIYSCFNSDRDLLATEWAKYYCNNRNLKLLNDETIIPIESTIIPKGETALEIGDAGEQIVFLHEKERVKLFNARLSQQKVLLLGKQRGLGYDIQSVWADLQTMFNKDADESFYIEVKSTRRITKPSFDSADKIILTRNEWLAANQHKECFSIFRVYLTRSGIFVYKIFNPLDNPNGFCTPIKYNYEFTVSKGLERWH